MLLSCAMDAGGAREMRTVIVAAQKKNIPCTVLSSAVTQPIFAELHIPSTVLDIHSPEEAERFLEQESFSVLIVGTTAAPKNERHLTLAAKKKKIPSIVLLDEWYLYARRFSDTEGKLTYLPDTICVQDELSKSLAEAEGLPAELLRITGSPSLAELAEKAREFRMNPPPKPAELIGGPDRLSLVFLSDIVKRTFGTTLGYDEEEVRSDLADILNTVGTPVLMLEKLHPSESSSALPKLEAHVDWKILEPGFPLWPLLWHSNIVVGMSTKALLEAAFLGKKPISYQPNVKIDPNMCTAVRFGLAELHTEKMTLQKRLLELLAEGHAKPEAELSLPAADPKSKDRVLEIIEEFLTKKA